ncbi:MAG: NADPH-dependent 2,4-dienoyl-CoA reductase, partial [Mycobacteriaceae bacterium]
TKPKPAPPLRKVYMLQRKAGSQGKSLGKTTGWVHRMAVKFKGVEQLSGVNYEKIDDAGLHISFGEKHENPRTLEVDNIVICAGQESVRDLVDALTISGVTTHVIGGADHAGELDAKRAIKQGTEVAAAL